jgi:hypothetical protein
MSHTKSGCDDESRLRFLVQIAAFAGPGDHLIWRIHSSFEDHKCGMLDENFDQTVQCHRGAPEMD